MELALRRAEITKYDIIMELKSMAFSNMSNYFRRDKEGELEVDEDGYPMLDLAKATPLMLQAIKEIIVEEYTIPMGDTEKHVKKMRFALHDKRAPLIDLARMMKMVQNPNINVQNNVQNNVVIMTEDEILAAR